MNISWITSLNCWQAYWNISLFSFDFVIIDRSRNLQRKLDALSQQSYIAPKLSDEILDQQKSIMLKSSYLQLKALILSSSKDMQYFKKKSKKLIKTFYLSWISKNIWISIKILLKFFKDLNLKKIFFYY